ncbi:MAG: tRNA (N(6)-L-threonylcarbamoyladenosine(37)-C(2))-methylthiotransferase MtaB [Clostridia bacterium]|nr:tRNA (N(6)-L-threonylcarbamoyladenosine(37)-C(2))-methylthiotransferase MtaB [Clostridia bacterium]
MDICVYTLGCKVNQYESGVVVAKLKKAGHNAFEGLKNADIYIINTCAVTSEAEKKSRQSVAKMIKLNPDCKIFVIGCASQNNAEQFKKHGNVKFIKGVASKTDIVDLIEKEGTDVEDLPLVYQNTEFAQITKTRQTIKIQEGCNNFCSYCLVPYLRGRSRSRDVQDILAEAISCKDKVNEIVLTGIDISSYGKNSGTNLGQLIKLLDEQVDVRLRIGSLEVNVITDEFLQILSTCKNFCPHFHLSLQSGCDRVLKKMNRHYTTEQYLQKVELIRRYFPDAGITTDIIVGFPEESDEMFAETCDFAKKVSFSDIHVFPFSVRKGTVAEKMKQVNDGVKKQRAETLSQVKLQLKQAFLSKYIGKNLQILTEDVDGEYIAGYTANYIKVYLPKDGINENTLYDVKTTGLFNDGLLAEVE